MIQDAPHISKAAFPESVFVLFAGVLSGRHIGISYTILVVFEEIVCDGLVINLHDGVHDFRFFLLRVRIAVKAETVTGTTVSMEEVTVPTLVIAPVVRLIR